MKKDSAIYFALNKCLNAAPKNDCATVVKEMLKDIKSDGTYNNDKPEVELQVITDIIVNCLNQLIAPPDLGSYRSELEQQIISKPKQKKTNASYDKPRSTHTVQKDN